MVQLIEKADHFIYIENQFFVSGFGQEKFGDGENEKPDLSPAADIANGIGFQGMLTRAAWGDANALPTNLICTALGNKLRSVILNACNPSPDGETSLFHIYITLPVHSEGLLNDQSVMTQVHYTMQSLVFGTQSLLNRTRRAILARKLLDKGDKGFERVFEDSNLEYEDVDINECWPYVTLLNLRHWAQLKDHCVTEQIYVHTKAMVVDDRYAIVGSANINDRSLIGNRDSEMAVLVMDTQTATEDIGAHDGPQLTRKFARELRMGTWWKLFCLSGAKANVKPATALQEALKRPAAQASWEAIRKAASQNTAAYEGVFPFIPRNSISKDDEDSDIPASIWPTRFTGRETVPDGLMPFDSKFWDSPQHMAAAVRKLTELQGFITLLPWAWTRGENNNCGYHSALYVDNQPAPSTSTKQSGSRKASISKPATDEETVG